MNIYIFKPKKRKKRKLIKNMKHNQSKPNETEKKNNMIMINEELKYTMN